jgi:hypothetical protein
MTLKLFHPSKARTIGYPFCHVKRDDCGVFAIDFRIIDRLNEPQKTHTISARCADGAQREGRTPTLLREPDFESGASASSAIRAYPFQKANLLITKLSMGQSAPLFS